MKLQTVLVLLVLVAAGFFALGRLTVPRSESPTQTAPAPQAAAPAAPSPAPQVQPPAPPPAAPEVFRVDNAPVRPPPPPPWTPPPGTQPAKDPSPSKGPVDAPVILLEVSDFQCPVCRRAYEPLRAIADQMPGTVRLVFKHNPLDMHRNALNAAAAAMAAARQGKFDAFADWAFQNQSSLDETSLLNAAQSLGLDMDRFRKDYNDPALRMRAKAEGNAAASLGAQGTPSFFINGQMQVGWASYEAIVQMVQREAEAVRGLTASGMSVREARIQRVRSHLKDQAEAFLASPLAVEFQKP